MAQDFISPQDVRKQQETNPAPLLIDVRAPEEFAAGHVAGAVHIPAGELPDRLQEIPQDRLAVPYCNMAHRGSSRSEGAAALLRESGYDAQALEGGYPAWEAAGYPTHTA